MNDDLFEAFLLKLFKSKCSLSPATIAQYSTVLRQFNATQSQDIKHSQTAALRDFVLAHRSEWSRRRAISALRCFYIALDLEERVEELLELGCQRPARTGAAKIAIRLARAGWSRRQIAVLRWDHVRNQLISRIEARPRIPKPVRAELLRMLCRRYPRSEQLVGDGPARALVFSSGDLETVSRFGT